MQSVMNRVDKYMSGGDLLIFNIKPCNNYLMNFLN